MRVHTHRFGDIDVPDEAILHFPEGIHGFPHFRRCCLLPYGYHTGLRWLQSLDDPALVFLTLEPHLVFPDYEVEIPDRDAIALDLTDPERAVVLTLVTVSEERSSVTANLLAPIVINTDSRRARQLILDGDIYTTRHLVGSDARGGIHAGLDPQEW